MFEQGQKTGRGKRIGNGPGKQEQKGGGWRCGQRKTRGIVNSHAPALHFGGNPASQSAVRGYEGGALTGCFECPAKCHCNDSRLFPWIMTDDKAEVWTQRSGQFVAAKQIAGTGPDGFSRSECFGDQADTCNRRDRPSGACFRCRFRPIPYYFSLDAKAL